ncbi:MAG: GTP-binding protein [Phycisphaerales bacterium]|nr:MAG: GTP-binding protein [Phycisphaerales bacterium]
MPTPPRYRLSTPPGRPAAIAIIDLTAATPADLDALLARLGMTPTDHALGVGEVRLRDLAGVDRGLVARLTPTHAQCMPHGGPGVVRALVAAMESAGAVAADEQSDAEYPEASDAIEAHTLAALARASSPLAVDLLLDQPRRWREAGEGAVTDPSRDARLGRLIEAATVAVVGAANIGKSTLLNALAGRAVATVADEPGTTRDHVGATLNLGGLVVRWLDTPGVREDPAPTERQAWAIAQGFVERADLVLLAGDAGAPPPRRAGRGGQSVLRVALRADLGAATWAHDVSVACLEDPVGLEGLVRMIREALVPTADLAHPGPWRFWGS